MNLYISLIQRVVLLLITPICCYLLYLENKNSFLQDIKNYSLLITQKSPNLQFAIMNNQSIISYNGENHLEWLKFVLSYNLFIYDYQIFSNGFIVYYKPEGIKPKKVIKIKKPKSNYITSS
jgi:hypothetical protein